jgi:hypothetical protein
MKRFKPSGPYPRHGTLADKAEWLLQWGMSWIIVDVPGKPALSGIATGLLMNLAIFALWALFYGVVWLVGHWR